MEIKHREFLKISTLTCHASTMAFYKEKPVYAWFGGSREGMPDCAIYIQCGDNVHTLGDKDHFPRWNPILFQYQDRLFLFIKIGVFCDRWATLIYDISDILESNFDITKIKSQILPAGLNGPVKTKPIMLGKYVYCGSSVETAIDWSSYIEKYYVKDGKFVLKDRSNPLTAPKKIYKDEYRKNRMSIGIIQPSLWVDSNKDLHAFFRSSRGLDKIYYSKMGANGEWLDPVPTNFDNPNSGIDTVCVDGRLFLVHNPSSDYRYPLAVSELDDQFNEKERLIVRENIEDNHVTSTAELSYPYMIEYNGNLHLVYTYGRSRIEYITIHID